MTNVIHMFSDMEDMEEVEVPFGSLEEEVADDVPVLLSEGEYVVPADVVRYWGLKHLEEMRTMAKCGLMSMEMDGRLHKVDDDDDGVEEEEVEVQEEEEEEGNEDEETMLMMQEMYSMEEPEMIDFDIDDMQEDMSEEEEEVDFDGKKKIADDDYEFDEDDLVFTVRAIGMDAGGDIQRDREDNFGLGVGNTATLGISNNDIMSAMAEVGMVSPNEAKSATPEQAATAVGGLANATSKERSDVMSAAVGTQFDRATTDVPAGVSKVAGFLGALASPKGFPSVTQVFSPSAQIFSGIPSAIGTNPMMQAVAKASLTELATIGLNINLGLQDKTDLMNFGGNVVGISTGTMLGMPTQTIAGVVDPQMDVADYDRAVAAALGKDLATAPTNEVTGRPDFSKAQDLMGVQTDPDTGAPTSGGYTSRGDFVDVTGQVSAMGTVEALGNLGFKGLADLEKSRPPGSFLGLDQNELEKAKQKATGKELADLEKEADMEKEMQDIMGAVADMPTAEEDENETVDATEEPGPDTDTTESENDGPEAEV